MSLFEAKGLRLMVENGILTWVSMDIWVITRLMLETGHDKVGLNFDKNPTEELYE